MLSRVIASKVARFAGTRDSSTPFAVPPRSRWYALEPQGLGSPYVESLLSFLLRVASEHVVDPVSLVGRELIGTQGKRRLSLSHDRPVARYARLAINGVGEPATTFTRLVERYTRPSVEAGSLASMTLQPWSGVLTPTLLLRSTRAWCPLCLQEWRGRREDDQDCGGPAPGGNRTGREHVGREHGGREHGGRDRFRPVVYEPLLWAVEAVTWCPAHNVPLQLVCPNASCGKRVPLLVARSRVGYCSSCSTWLGSTTGEPSVTQPYNSDEGKWRLWIAESVGEMLAAGPEVASSLPQDAVRDSLFRCTRFNPAGGDALADLCRRTGVTHNRLQEAFRGRKLIKLGTLLHLCYCLRTRPLAFLQRNRAPVYPSEIQLPACFERSKSLALTGACLVGDVELEPLRIRARAYISSCPNPPTLEEVALEVGVQPQYLYRRLPEVCSEVAARRREFRDSGFPRACVYRARQACDAVE